MGTLIEILAERETRQRENLRRQWAAYRTLIEKSNASTLTADDGDTLAELMTTLKLTPAEVEAHCQSLRDHAALQARIAKATEIERRLAELNPRIEILSEKRAAALQEVDGLLQPLLFEAAGLSQSLQSHHRAIEWGQDRETAKFKFLYGAGFEAPPPPRPQPTAAQQEESRRRAEHFDYWTRVREGLLKCGKRNPQWSHIIQTSITKVFQYGLEQHPDPLLFRPENGWPRVEDGYDPGIVPDPRKKQIISLARAAKKPNTELDAAGEYLLSVGREIGILDRTNTPIATAEAISDEEAGSAE